MSLSTQIKVLGGLPTAGSPPAASSLSADEIFTALDGSMQYAVAGGTANARTVAAPGFVLQDGALIYFAIPIGGSNSGATTLNVNGTGAKSIYKVQQAGGGVYALEGLELMQYAICCCAYSALNDAYVLLSAHRMTAAQIPPTLNATTFGGDVILAKGVNTDYSSLLRAAANDYLISLCGGSAIGGVYGAYMQMWGNGHYSTPGDAKYYTGSASGAKHSFFDKNGVEQLRVNESGVTSYGDFITSSGIVRANTITAPSAVLIQYSGSAAGKSSLSGGDNTGNGAEVMVHGPTHATYPGAHQQLAPLSTRAASTAFAVCPVATGDAAVIDVFSGGGTGIQVLVHVDVAGTVTLQNPADGVTYNSAYQVTSSPTASQVGIYWSAGIVYIKPGSDFTGGSAIKIATFSKIAKA